MPGWGLVLESHGRGGRPRLGRFVNQNQNLVIEHGRREKGWLMPFWAILGKFLHLLDFDGGFSSACPRFPWTGRLYRVFLECSHGVQGREPTGPVLPPVHRQLTVAENCPSGAIDPWSSGCRGLQGLSSLGP